jgi:predicted HAD superfamily Cof-like phosphohydrolase
MKTQIDMVADFQRRFAAPILDTPTIPSVDRCELRIDLIKEELRETTDAVNENDMVEVADGLGDILYVVYGMILEFGLQDKIVDIFAEIHRSNMSKACLTRDEAIATQEHYMQLTNTKSYYTERDGNFFVYREDNNKALKSINYSRANIKSFL